MNTINPFQGALWIVMAGVGLGIGYNLLHPDPLPWKAEPKKTVVLVDPTEVDPGEAAPGGKDPGTETEAVEETGETVSEKTPGGNGSGTPTTNPARNLYQDIPESEFPIEIHTAKAKELYDRGGLLVLDAREEIEYSEGHIKGSVSAYGDQMLGEPEWLEATAKDPRPIMVYCGGGDCDLSLNLGFEIARMGHRKVMVFMEGYPAWEAAGYPVETGDMP